MRQEADRHPDEDVWRNFRLHPDLVLAEGWWLTRTGRARSAPEIRVDQVRDLVREIAGAPFEARRRVFVIDDAHTMNESAQNALLKTLEEPARAAVIWCRPGLGLRPRSLRRQRLRFAASRAAMLASWSWWRDARGRAAEGCARWRQPGRRCLARCQRGLRQRDEIGAPGAGVDRVCPRLGVRRWSRRTTRRSC
jgi:hypothetical protein